MFLPLEGLSREKNFENFFTWVAPYCVVASNLEWFLEIAHIPEVPIEVETTSKLNNDSLTLIMKFPRLVLIIVVGLVMG